MLIIFKCKGAADIHMFSEQAEPILAIVGKSLEPAQAPRGIITAGEAAAALERLRAAASDAKPRPGERDAEGSLPLTLSQRAFPLIGMLERAAAKKLDIVWGV